MGGTLWSPLVDLRAIVSFIMRVIALLLGVAFAARAQEAPPVPNELPVPQPAPPATYIEPIPSSHQIDPYRYMPGRQVHYTRGFVQFTRLGRKVRWNLRQGELLLISPTIAQGSLEFGPDADSPFRLEVSLTKAGRTARVLTLRIDSDEPPSASYPEMVDENAKPPSTCSLTLDSLDERSAKGSIRCSGSKGWEGGPPIQDATFEVSSRR
jgi:hypothetical protein